MIRRNTFISGLTLAFVLTACNTYAGIYTEKVVCKYQNLKISKIVPAQFDVDEFENSYFLLNDPLEIAMFDKTGKLVFKENFPEKITSLYSPWIFTGKNTVLIVPLVGSNFYVFDCQNKVFNNITVEGRSAAYDLQYVNGNLVNFRSGGLVWRCETASKMPDLIPISNLVKFQYGAMGAGFYKLSTNFKIPEDYLTGYNFYTFRGVDIFGNIFACYGKAKEGKTQYSDDDFYLARLNATDLHVEQFWDSCWRFHEIDSTVYSIAEEQNVYELIKWTPNEVP